LSIAFRSFNQSSSREQRFRDRFPNVGVSDNGLTPNPQQKLLLEAVLLRGDEAIRAWRAWQAANRPDATDRPSRRLLPAVYRNLRDAGLPDVDLAPLRDAYEKSSTENQQKLGAARRPVEALVAAGIDVLILKGAALTRFYAGDPALRSMRDIDVLVPPDQIESASATLAALGYEPDGIGACCVGRYAYGRSPGWPFVARNAPDVDLHWHVLHESRQPDADGDFWRAAIALDFQGVAVKALNATDQLLHVCVHGLQREPQANVRWIVDAMRILRNGAEPIDWPRLLAQVARRRLVLQVRYCFEFLTAAFAAPIPAHVLEQIRRAPVSWLERVEFRSRLRPEPRGTLRRAVLAHQQEARRRSDGSLPSFRRALPRYLWGASRWWQRPAWAALDRLGLELRPGTAWARRVFAPPREATSPKQAPVYELGQRLVFGRDGNGLAALRSGWSYAETAGVWSEGLLARLELEVQDVPERALVLEIALGAALISESHPPLVVHVLVDSSRVARWRFTAPLSGPTIYQATVPAGVLAASRPCPIDFRILSPRSPASLGWSADPRLLGIHLSSLRLGGGAPLHDSG
jgi:putative nucleotidyltransferase-like protein